MLKVVSYFEHFKSGTSIVIAFLLHLSYVSLSTLIHDNLSLSFSIWMQYLREEISRIDETWTAARFDSLPHVVHILTSKDRDAAAQFLKEQSDVIEEVVDEVVQSYHTGFNRAIQNYSQVSENFIFYVI